MCAGGTISSTYAASGPYDKIAPILFSDENAEAFYLEYDDERSGGFEPLKYVTGNKKVVLGLITTKSPVLEKKEEVIARIHEAENIFRWTGYISVRSAVFHPMKLAIN